MATARFLRRTRKHVGAATQAWFVTTVKGAVATALFLFLLVGPGAVGELSADTGFRKDSVRIVTSSGVVDIAAEMADTPAKQAKGLMFRRALGPKEGMLFLYSPDQEVHMWMRNTYIPLDMVFIKRDGTIHRIERQTEPFSEAIIASKGQVAGVLEINGGAARRLGIRVGDRVLHKHFASKPH